MTGTHMLAADALHIGLGTHAIPATAWPTLVDGLANARWRGDLGRCGEHRGVPSPRAVARRIDGERAGAASADSLEARRSRRCRRRCRKRWRG